MAKTEITSYALSFLLAAYNNKMVNVIFLSFTPNKRTFSFSFLYTEVFL